MREVNKQKNTASQGITINQLKPNKHVLANFPEASLCLAERKVVWSSSNKARWFLNQKNIY